MPFIILQVAYQQLYHASQSPTPLHFAFAIGCFEAEGPFIGGTGHRDEVHLGTAPGVTGENSELTSENIPNWLLKKWCNLFG